MDFIERLFHLSPDEGSGLTELVYFLAISAAVLGWAFRRQISGLIQRGFRVGR